MPDKREVNLELATTGVAIPWGDQRGDLIIKRITQSSQVALALLINVLLVPIVTFYLLRDWDHIVE